MKTILNRKSPALLYVLLMWFASTNVLADQRWFHIEVIIFKQYSKTDEQFIQSESRVRWPSGTVTLSDAAYSLGSLKQSPKAFAKVQAADRLLNDSYYALKKNASYIPLVQLSWVQNVAANQIGRGLRISTETLSGVIRLQRGNYLHLLTDIEYKPAEIFYTIKEKRRLRLHESHYLDHPKFGIIAKVVPLF